MKETISVKLFNILNKGREQLSKEALCRITRFVESQKTDDNAFINKNKTVDLYYTMFGLLLACVLGIRTDNKKTSLYLKRQNTENMDLIHYAAFVRCKLLQILLAGSKTLHAGNKALLVGNKALLLLNSISAAPVKQLHELYGFPHDDAESPYSRFIWLSLMEDANRKVKYSDEIKASLMDYHIPEGGYSNIKGCENAATNATVAALAVLGQLYGYKENKDILFLKELQQESGGFAATANSPVPDLLSTATSLFIMHCYNMKPKNSPRNFIEAHWLDSGGFSATLLDETSDVEYTFYGLLALGTLYDYDTN
jgi:prenyltransferase beta subunit